MPPYDPKANRPRVVPPPDDAAPVDALLGPVDAPVEAPAPDPTPRPTVESASEPTAEVSDTVDLDTDDTVDLDTDDTVDVDTDEIVDVRTPADTADTAERPHLSLVPEGAAPRVVPDPPAGRRGDPRVIVALAAVGVAAVVAAAIAVRRWNA